MDIEGIDLADDFASRVYPIRKGDVVFVYVNSMTAWKEGIVVDVVLFEDLDCSTGGVMLVSYYDECRGHRALRKVSITYRDYLVSRNVFDDDDFENILRRLRSPMPSAQNDSMDDVSKLPLCKVSEPLQRERLQNLQEVVEGPGLEMLLTNEKHDET